MYRIRRAASARYTANHGTRWAQPFTKRQLLQAARALWPMLATLTFATAAHAQGTMDFSGATTLMQTFNPGTPAIQARVVLPKALEVVTEDPVRAIEGQRESIRDL